MVTIWWMPISDSSVVAAITAAITAGTGGMLRPSQPAASTSASSPASALPSMKAQVMSTSSPRIEPEPAPVARSASARRRRPSGASAARHSTGMPVTSASSGASAVKLVKETTVAAAIDTGGTSGTSAASPSQRGRPDSIAWPISSPGKASPSPSAITAQSGTSGRCW